MLRHHPAARSTFPAYSTFATSLDALIDELRPPCPRFVLFVAADVSARSDDALAAWAGSALDRGVAYACCWGPDAGRLETAFDFAAIDRETDATRADDVSVIMTTAHETETLREAAWFALNAAYPAGVFEEGTDAVVLAVVGMDGTLRELIEYLESGAPLTDAV